MGPPRRLLLVKVDTLRALRSAFALIDLAAPPNDEATAAESQALPTPWLRCSCG